MRRCSPEFLLALLAVAVWFAHPASAFCQANRGGVQPGGDFPPLSPPVPIFGHSPVDFFRSLLKMTPEERELALTGRPDQQVKGLLAKVAEYEAMPAKERNLKLRLISLRFYLTPLMHIDPTNRTGMLAAVPSEDRPLVEERLRRWDRVPPSVQREFLANEATIQYFLRLEFSGVRDPSTLLNRFPPEARTEVERAMARWKTFPPERRRQMYASFHKFFELSEPDREKTLGALTELERTQIEASLQSFARLPESDRNRCIESFRRFANMSEAERSDFFHNAERWQQMSPAERQSWRELVEKLSSVPPLPPGLQLGEPPMPGPPMPPPPGQ